MNDKFPHAMLPRASHDEAARRDFVSSFKVHVLHYLGPENRTVYDARVEPAFRKAHDRKPETPREIASVMYRDSFWQTWSSLNRTSQELMWDGLGACVERQLPGLIEKARATRGKNDKKGSLRLKPDLEIPRYNSSIDIHCQPGGYHTEIADEDDVYAGALFDVGAFNYALGGQGPLNDEMGTWLAEFVKRTFPDLSPERILDMGCGVGHHTLPFVEAYPDADVYACDLGAPMVRYAHARAEALGKAVHYSQQNAEFTDFEDQSFDLVASSVLLHETSAKALRNIFAEFHRLLRPGGIMVHCEVPEANRFWPDPYDRFQRDWTTHFNAEPFRTAVRETEATQVAVKAGFPESGIIETSVESDISSVYGRPHAYAGKWWMFAARK